MLARRLLDVWQGYDQMRQRDKAAQMLEQDRQRQQQDDEFKRLAMMQAAGLTFNAPSETSNVPQDVQTTPIKGGPAMGPIRVSPVSNPDAYVGDVGGQRIYRSPDYYRQQAAAAAKQRREEQNAEAERRYKLAEALKAEAEARAAGQPKKQESDNWQTVQGGNGYYQVNPRTGATRPLAGITPKPTDEVNWQTIEGGNGFYQVNPKTGQVRPVRGVTPKPKTDNGPTPSDFEKKAAFMLEGAQRASKVLDNYTAPARTVVRNIPGLGNYGLTETDQVAQQAAETMYDAYLRLTTGATIAPEELKNAAKQFVPQPGDTPGALRAKAVRRHEILRAMQKAAAPAQAREARVAGTMPAAPAGVPFREY